MKKLHLGHMLVCLCVLAIGSVVGMATKEALASRNAAGTMSGINGPYVSGTTISSSVVNARLADIETEITDSLDRSGKGGMLAVLRGVDGTNAAPAFSFTSETGTGEYRVGAGDLGVAISGTKVADWNANGLGIGGAATNKLDITVAGSATTNLGNWLEASLADGNSVSLNIGKTAGAGGLGILTYTKNATAVNSTFCTGVFGGSTSTLCVDGNNAATAGGTFAVTGASTLTGALAANGGAKFGSTGTAISASYRGTTSWTPGSLGPGICASTSITITGAVAATECQYGIPGAPVDGLVPMCWVTLNTCTLKWCYTGATSATPPSGTYACRAMNP